MNYDDNDDDDDDDDDEWWAAAGNDHISAVAAVSVAVSLTRVTESENVCKIKVASFDTCINVSLLERSNWNEMVI